MFATWKDKRKKFAISVEYVMTSTWHWFQQKEKIIGINLLEKS